MLNNPSIVIVTYNRLDCLIRLLESLSIAVYPDIDIQLIISVDYYPNNIILDYVYNFNWKFGTKTIITHSENLGLRNHVILCGDLVDEYDTVIVLEDDLIVSPSFYQFSIAALEKYNNTERIAGIGLYSYSFNQTSLLPFAPIADNYDCYFMKVPCSWGQLWTKAQWQRFKKWYNQGPVVTGEDFIPQAVIDWPETSWKKYFWKYLVDADKYFVYPAGSYSTNCGDIGIHHHEALNEHHVHLSIKSNGFTLPTMEETINVYDQFFEMLPTKLPIAEKYHENIEIDMNGSKPLNLVPREYTLSIKKCNKPIKYYPIHCFPLPLNIIQCMDQCPSVANFVLGKTVDFENEIDPSFVGYISSRVAGHVHAHIVRLAELALMKKDAYMIGHRFVRFLDSLPNVLGNMLRTTKLFSNKYTKQ